MSNEIICPKCGNKNEEDADYCTSCSKKLKYSDELKKLHDKCFELHEAGQYEEALECYEIALQINPRIEASWANKAVVLALFGKYADARACCNIALI